MKTKYGPIPTKAQLDAATWKLFSDLRVLGVKLKGVTLPFDQGLALSSEGLLCAVLFRNETDQKWCVLLSPEINVPMLQMSESLTMVEAKDAARRSAETVYELYLKGEGGKR